MPTTRPLPPLSATAAPNPSACEPGPPLCVADDSTFWPWHAWTDIAAWPDKAATIVVIPLVGFADWGLGHALDLEETLALAVLASAAASPAPPAEDIRLLTLPPLRFVFGVDPGAAFAADAPTTHRFIEEVVASVAAAGFTRIVLFNSSPWNEDVIDVAARDLRIARGLRMFCVNLSGLGIDLHPARSRSRRIAQTLTTWLTGAEPDPAPARSGATGWPEAETVAPLPGPARSLADAAREGPALLATAGARLRALLGEIAARPALPHEGRLATLPA